LKWFGKMVVIFKDSRVNSVTFRVDHDACGAFKGTNEGLMEKARAIIDPIEKDVLMGMTFVSPDESEWQVVQVYSSKDFAKKRLIPYCISIVNEILKNDS